MRTYTSMPGIRARRRMLRMKSQELADALGVSRQSLSSWENGSLMPSAGILPALADALGCRIEDLYQGEEGEHGQAADED